MPEPSLITDYLTALSAQLPGPIVEELADGLDQACRGYLERGLTEDAAASAAVAEFGDQRVLVAGFTDASPARRTARRLLVTGPGAGLSWGAALITARAWTWPVPVAGRAAFAAALLIVIGLLALAMRGHSYQSVRRAAAAACAGIGLLDVSMLTVAFLVAPAMRWPLALAMAASFLRIAYVTRALGRTVAS